MTPNEAESSKYNLELFFEHSLDLLCIAGFDGYFKRINPIVSKTLGYTEEELYSRPINDFVHPLDKELTIQSRKSVHSLVPLLNFENRYLTKTGETVWLAWTSIPIESEKLVFAVAKVVTHRKQLEEDRNNQIATLTKRNSELKQLTYTTSHDLRAPVSNLLALFDMMDTSRIHDEDTLEFITMLKTASENLKDTLNSYVDVLSQGESRQVLTEDLDMQACLDAVKFSLASLIAASRANITVDFSEFDTINFNKAFLESIFLNLITNAIKYTTLGTKPVIRTFTRVQEGRKQLVFEDEGQGFDMETVGSRLFGFNQKFHDGADNKGIGLYLVHNHVSSLGGHIDVESQPGKGARFVITFKG